MRGLFIAVMLSFAAPVASAEALEPATLQVASVAPTAATTVAPATTPAPEAAESPAPTETPDEPPCSVEAIATGMAATIQAAAISSTAAMTGTVTAMLSMTAAATDEVAGDDDVDDAPRARIALPTKAPSAQELTLQYQRVGRDLLKLEEQRGKFDCGGVIPRFKAIKLETALATPAARMQLYVDLTEMATKIDRLRGIKVDSACLQNPLAAGCM